MAQVLPARLLDDAQAEPLRVAAPVLDGGDGAVALGGSPVRGPPDVTGVGFGDRLPEPSPGELQRRHGRVGRGFLCPLAGTRFELLRKPNEAFKRRHRAAPLVRVRELVRADVSRVTTWTSTRAPTAAVDALFRS